MTISRKLYWSLAAITILFLILLNVLKVQDIVARKFGYAGSVPMFALDQMPLGYSPQEVFEVMTAYGEAGRRAYAFLLLTCDLVFPFLYGSFLFLSIWAVSRKAGVTELWAAAFAGCGYVATVFDWMENISFLDLIWNFPRESTGVARLASFFTVSKFFFSGVSLVVLAVLGIYVLGKSRKTGSPTKSS